MTDNRTTELREKLDELGVEHHDTEHMTEWHDARGLKWNYFSNGENTDLTLETPWESCTPEQAIAATLGDETPKKCSTCQYRYCVGQRPYPSFGYMCGFGDGKKLCGSNTGVLDHMCCEHWEKELR